MNTIKLRSTAGYQSRIAVSTDATFGMSAWACADVAPVNTHVPALSSGATGARSWSPPPC